MDLVLTMEELEEDEPISILDDASVALVRQRVRARGEACGLDAIATGKLVNIASELSHNQLAHAVRGTVVVREISRAGVPGLEVIAVDEGPGIADPTRALLQGPRVPKTSDGPGKKSLGIGLAAVLELADEVDFDVRMGAGTCVLARKFGDAVPRRRQLGIYARPYPGERVNGDDACFVRADDALLVGVADGLGHGPSAREAAVGATNTLRAHPELSPLEILERGHAALRATRGAVMAVARVLETTNELETACVGNVSTHVYGPQVARRFIGSSFVLGAAGMVRRVQVDRCDLGVRDALVLFTDGLTTRVDLEGELDLLREHPIIIAHQLFTRFGREHDDALVLVAR